MSRSKSEEENITERRVEKQKDKHCDNVNKYQEK